MRRVDRGSWPLDDQNNPKRFQPYNKAKADLLERLGRYCSYCERRGDLHIDHVVPKSHRPDLEEKWTNMLLGCSNCNGTKSDNNRSRQGYLWPDKDNTEAAFSYLPDGIVRVRNNLPGPIQRKAQRLFDLVGLGKSRTKDPRAKDLRRRDRREAWRTAEIARQNAKNGASVDMVITLAKATGFFSVWMAVFANEPQICSLLRNSFPGTR